MAKAAGQLINQYFEKTTTGFAIDSAKQIGELTIEGCYKWIDTQETKDAMTKELFASCLITARMCREGLRNSD